MKKTLRVCSVLLALSLVLFSCKQPEEPAYVEYSPSDLTVTNKATGTRKAVTAETPSEIKKFLQETIGREIHTAIGSAQEELETTYSDYKAEVKARNDAMADYNNSNKETKSYTSSYTAREYDLPKSNGKYNLIKDISSASKSPSSLEFLDENKFNLNMNLKNPSTTKAILFSNHEYSYEKESMPTESKEPKDINMEMKMEFSTSGMAYFDNGVYAGYVKIINYNYINGTKMFKAIKNSLEKNDDFSKELIAFLENGTTQSQKVKDFINPLLKANTSLKECIVIYDNDGKNPYTMKNDEKYMTIDDIQVK